MSDAQDSSLERRFRAKSWPVRASLAAFGSPTSERRANKATTMETLFVFKGPGTEVWNVER